MLQLSGRALTASALDSELFVDREPELKAIERASRLRFNVYLEGQAGTGKTSLLRRVQARAEQPLAFVSAASIGDFDELLVVLAKALGPAANYVVEVGSGSLLERLRAVTAGARTDTGPTILVDVLDPRLRHELFGRQRDELWELPIRWVVSGRDRLVPPADAFFEMQLRLELLGSNELHEMLERRAATGDEVERGRMLELAGSLPLLLAPASPRALLAAARSVMVSPDPPAALRELRRQRDARVHLSGPGLRVLEALDALGPTYAGDERLLREVGTSRSRVVQLLRELEEDGLVVASRDGRRKLYGASELSLSAPEPAGVR